jgi:hypothetical protein
MLSGVDIGTACTGPGMDCTEFVKVGILDIEHAPKVKDRATTGGKRLPSNRPTTGVHLRSTSSIGPNGLKSRQMSMRRPGIRDSIHTFVDLEPNQP